MTGTTETSLAARLARLTPAQRALLDARVRDLRRATPSLDRIPKRRRPNRNRLTVDQERIWLIHQFDPTDPVYNVFLGWRLRGDLDVSALERAVNAVVARHEALRTTFEVEDLRPVQVIHDEMPITFRRLDLRALPEAEREPEMVRLATEEIRRPMDITRGPLLRVALIRMAEREHVMVCTIDHLVWDRGSVGIFDREVAEYYTAFVTGREPRLPELEIQYADYAEWQPEWLREEVYRRQLPYWIQQLAGAPLVLELPTDRPRPPVQTFNGARYEFRMSAALTEGIRRLARAEGVTPNITLLAAWNLLLYRYTGQRDIVIGTTSSTRSRAQTEPVIGYFLTMLPLRTTVDPQMTFRDLLAATRTTMVGALDHHDMPFGTLLDELRIERDPSRNPVYQVSFIFVDFHEEPVSLPDLVMEPLVFDNRTAKDDCMLCVFDDPGVADHYFGLFEYNTDLFTESTIARMWRHLEHLLTQVVADPDQRVQDLSLLDAEDTRTLLVEWNRTAVPREPELCLEDLVRRQAARTPDAVAVVAGDQRLRYAELVGRAERLAGYLRARGAGPESVVGVCLDRSVDLVVGLLGVVMAGAAYLPLDPGYPARRLATMVTDAGARLLLTRSDLAGNLADCPAELIHLDREAEAIAAAAARTEPDPVRDDRLAYVIYTSGSTGRPKGVEVTHRNLVNLLLAMADEIGLGPDDVLAAVTSITFDIAGLELYGPLVTGGRVVLVGRDEAQDGRRLAALLDRVGATVVQATPATWQLLVEAGWPNERGIRVITGGEALPVPLARALAERADAVWNVYGPTETTIWSTAWRLDPAAGRISIGRPLANTEVYVLDARLRPVPVGTPGELVIGGAGVARGYRGRPDLTAERFIPDHLGPRPGGRLYRTGDQVRLQPDGTLVFLGRDDGQVKVRGHRIELGEIETRLAEHPDVARAVVTVREDRPGDQRLVAYVVARSTGDGRPAALRPEALREHLRAYLPDYMIPNAVVEVADFPLTSSGKIDRRALPAPPADRRTTDVAAPRDPVELEVARIWEDVLGVRPIGLHDNFFDLGGHSLLVLRLMAEIERAFGRALPMAAIFQGATVERFARTLREGYQPPTGPHLIEIRPGSGGPPVFFAHPAGSEVVCYVPFARLVEPADRPLYAIACPPLDEAGRMPFAGFAERAAAYAELVRQAQPHGPYTLVGWCYGGANAFAVGRALEDQGEQVTVVLIDSHTPQYVPVEQEPDRAAHVEGLAKNLRWDYTDDLRPLDELRAMTDAEQLDYLLELARKGDYLPPDAGHEQIRTALDLWIANLRLLWRYRPTPLAGRLVMIRAGDEPDEDLYAGWERLAGNGLERHVVAGNHYTIMREPRIADVTAIVNGLLAEGRNGTGRVQHPHA